MEGMEADLGQDNPLTGISVLEKICAFTKADKTDAKTDQTLNNALLTWVAHDLKAAAQTLARPLMLGGLSVVRVNRED